jgi:hypothetical protein
MLLVAIGGAMLVTGIVGVVMGQPYHVYFPLLLAGFILVCVLTPLLPVIRMRYAQAEHRRLDADSMRRS